MKKKLIPLGLSLLVLSIGTFLLIQRKHDQRYNAIEPNGMVRFLGGLENLWYDFRFQSRPVESTQNRVFIARIDDPALELYGRWPWTRGLYNDILTYLYQAGAKVVAFDAVFSEPEYQPEYVRSTFEFEDQANNAPSLMSQLKLIPEQLDILSSRLPVIGDLMFSKAIVRYPKTVLGYLWQGHSACPLYDPNEKSDLEQSSGIPWSPQQARDRGRLHVDQYADRLGYLVNQGISIEGMPLGMLAQSPVFFASCPVVNRPQITARSRYQGFFSAAPDRDGLYRRLIMVQALHSEFIPKSARDFLPEEWFRDATFFPSLTVQSIRAYLDSDRLNVRLSQERNTSVVTAIEFFREGKMQFEMATLPDGTLPVLFYGTQNMEYPPVPEFSLAHVQQIGKDKDWVEHYGLDSKQPLKDAIVIIGPTAMGVSDLRANPVQEDAPGVNLHATAIARMIENYEGAKASSVRYASFPVSFTIMWVLGMILALVLVWSPAVRGLFTFLGLIALFLAVDYFVFIELNLVLDAMFVMLTLAILFSVVFTYKYFAEERDRAFVKGAFEKYVSPDLVSQIVKDPKKLNLGGQKKELTVLFSDVRGFTTISERMSAEELAAFMNEYLTPMTDIVQTHQGTIDKYMGDAIMAIFGAPVPYDNHPAKAVDAALGMIAKLKELNQMWQARGLPAIDIGIGINTGEMSVGNMGSQKIFSYTVMGDAVNLGSRVEGINKEYATRLIVTQGTRAKLPVNYVCRELDRVKVKGKVEPVTIYEVVGREDVDRARLGIVKNFEYALQLYYDQKFTQAREIFQAQAEQDPTARIYVERCVSWMKEPPPEKWDGSWTMKTK